MKQPSFPARLLKLLLAIIAVGSLMFFTKMKSNEKVHLRYPILQAVPATDVYFGKIIIDKFRALENANDTNVQKWMLQERTLSDSVLNNIPYRDSLKHYLEDVIYSSNIRGGFPVAAGKKLFFVRSYMKEKTRKIFYKDSLTAKEVVIFSTESLNTKNRTYSIDYYSPSYDGNYLAFGLSSNGDEMSVIKIVDVKNKVLLGDSIARAPYGCPFWLPGTYSFFYSQIKEINSDADYKTKYEDMKVMLHKIGNSVEKDQEVFSRTLNSNLSLDKIDFPYVCAFPGSDKVIAFARHGSTAYSALYYASLSDFTQDRLSPHIAWKKIYSADEKITRFALNNQKLYTLSYKDNSNGILRVGDLVNESMITLMEGKEDVLEDIAQTNNSIYVKKLKNGNSSIVQINLTNRQMSSINLPFSGYAYIRPTFNASPVYLNSSNLFFALDAWNQETGVYCYEAGFKHTTKLDTRPQGTYGNPTDIVVKEVEVPSHDGVLVPLSIIYSKNSKLNGKNPTLLEGYGAYGVLANANFNLATLVWLKMGGVYAVAHVRGGGEKGDAWYKGGYKATKPNSWKDFIACAEYLIKNKYTTSQQLAAKGTSAGGITVGRALTERPELFKAAILNVAKLNTLRSENASNSLSVSEYGTVKDSIEFKHVLEMDVYHHIKDNVQYPALFFTAGMKDSRVDWWQPAKAVARFQEVSTLKPNIVLFKINDFGHFGSADKVQDATDEYAFLFWQLQQRKLRFN